MCRTRSRWGHRWHGWMGLDSGSQWRGQNERENQIYITGGITIRRITRGGRIRKMSEGGPRWSWTLLVHQGGLWSPWSTWSTPIHSDPSFSNFTENVDQGGSRWTRRTRGTITPLGGLGVVFTFCWYEPYWQYKERFEDVKAEILDSRGPSPMRLTSEIEPVRPLCLSTQCRHTN